LTFSQNLEHTVRLVEPQVVLTLSRVPLMGGSVALFLREPGSPRGGIPSLFPNRLVTLFFPLFPFFLLARLLFLIVPWAFPPSLCTTPYLNPFRRQRPCVHTHRTFSSLSICQLSRSATTETPFNCGQTYFSKITSTPLVRHCFGDMTRTFLFSSNKRWFDVYSFSSR